MPIPTVLATCSDATRWRDVTRALAYTTLGHGTVVTTPAPLATLPALVPPSAIDKTAAAVLYDAVVFTEASVLALELAGRATQDLAGLAAYVVDGDIRQVIATGGVALPRAVAQAIGVGVGHRVQVAVRPASPDPKAEPAPLEVSYLEVAALLSFPVEALTLLRSSGFVHRDFAPRLHSSIRDGEANALIVWSAEPAARPSFALSGKLPKAAAVVESTFNADEATNRLVDTMRALGCPSP